MSRLLIWVVAACLGTSHIVLAQSTLPSLQIEQRIWQDAKGHVLTLIHTADKELTIHDLNNGATYRYTQDATRVHHRPVDAPDIQPVGAQKIQLGERTLTPYPHFVEKVNFSRDRVQFSGLLYLPVSDVPVPLIISGHGSEKSGATSFAFEPGIYLQAGYAVLVFDKRGTGNSQGKFTHHFATLAEDMNAAFYAMQQHSAIDTKQMGFYGPSQGVFVTTLAASQNPDVAFLIEGFGVLATPLMEDLMETQQRFARHYPELSWTEFKPLVDACGKAFALGEEQQWSTVRTLKKLWRNRIDAKHLTETLTGDGCLSYPPFLLSWFGRRQLPPGLIWDFDPRPIVDALEIPILWLYAGADQDAPSTSSIAQVRAWQSQGKPFALMVYPKADHGMRYWYQDAAGQQVYRHDADFFQDQILWLQARTAG